MKLPQTGGCQCGKLRYEITGEPRSVYTCHCLDCQRLTSSAFSLGIVVPETGFRLAGSEPRQLSRTADSGRVSVRLVCPECGSWVCGTPRGGEVRVRGGTLDDNSWLRPTRHIWTRRKQAWVTLPQGDEVFEGQPG
ncbi:MAG: GFA family protein [Alphaproteobacteria bacterium]